MSSSSNLQVVDEIILNRDFISIFFFFLHHTVVNIYQLVFYHILCILNLLGLPIFLVRYLIIISRIYNLGMRY